MESGWRKIWERSTAGSEEIFTVSHQLCCCFKVNVIGLVVVGLPFDGGGLLYIQVVNRRANNT